MRAKTIYIRTTNGEELNNLREDGAPVSIQAILEDGHCRSFSDVWRQSVSRSGRKNSKSRFPPGKMKTWLTDLEVVPSEVTSSWRFKELLRRRVQVTMEQLVHRDESSTGECRSIEGSLSSWRRSGYGSLLKLFTHLVPSRCILMLLDTPPTP